MSTPWRSKIKEQYRLNKAGLKGTYDLRVIVDDEKFDTGIQITC